MTDKRREELLEQMYNSSSNEVEGMGRDLVNVGYVLFCNEDEGLIKEWIALVTERDEILKKTIDKVSLSRSVGLVLQCCLCAVGEL